MGRVQWIKIDTDIYKNEKVRLARDMAKNGIETMMVWIALLALAGKRNDHGRLMATENLPYTPKMLAGEFSFPLKLVEESLTIFETLQMVLQDEDGAYYIRDWKAHQNLEKLEHERELARARQERFRAKKKEASEKPASKSGENDELTQEKQLLAEPDKASPIVDTPHLTIHKMPDVVFEAEEEDDI